MPTDCFPTNLARHDWLTEGPLNVVISAYVDALRGERYSERTIHVYLGSLAHFSYWLKTETLELSCLDPSVVKHFLLKHLPNCTCPQPCYSTKPSAGAALRHLLRIVPLERPLSVVPSPVDVELKRFGDYLANTRGLATVTRDRRVQDVGAFLARVFGSETPILSQISAPTLDAYFVDLSVRFKPVTLRIVGNGLRSYFRYRGSLGDSTAGLIEALPRVAEWGRTRLPKVLSEAELEAFLSAFDCTDPVGLRDYAIARCLVDLGLRGHEVTNLTLESVRWRDAILTINSTKGKRVQQMPLPESTGKAIAQYLRGARPQTTNRALFVRHRAPFDKPLGVPAIRNAMNRAFGRCGLSERFCNTHVLRRTTATRLQRSGASIKEIADVLRHQSLDTASTYARVDLEGLRAVALPWPGSPR